MDDYWMIVLLFLDTKDLSQLLKLNKAYKKYVSLFHFKQTLTVTNRTDFAEFLSYVSNVRYLSLRCFHETKIMSYIGKLDSLQFLDLWSDFALLWDHNLLRLPPNLIGLRIDVDLNSPLNLLPLLATQLQHLTIYCTQNVDFSNIVQMLLQFKSLKCVHIYRYLISDHIDCLKEIESNKHKLECIMTIDLFYFGLLKESFICKHVC